MVGTPGQLWLATLKCSNEPDNTGTRGGTVPGAVATGRLSKRPLREAPGRYRSRYCTNVGWYDLTFPGANGFCGWRAGKRKCAPNVRQTSVCRGRIGKPLEETRGSPYQTATN